MSKKTVVAASILGLFLLSAAVCTAAGGGADTELQNECADQLNKVMDCLDFAKGTTATPSAKCCGSVKDMKDSNPKCLCFIIQQAHGGSSDMVKSLGIQEAKLLQLPSACQIKNASVSDCPKILGISPSSPDAAVFSGNASTSTTPAATTSAETANKGGASRPEMFSVGSTAVVIGFAIFLYAFPTGAGSVFYKWD